MWASGNVRRRKHQAVNDMIALAQREANFETPWDQTPGVWQFYADEAEILVDLQDHWRRALAGALYVAIDRGGPDLAHEVRATFTALRDRHLAVRLILESHAGHPAIAAAMRKEQSLLAGFLRPAPAAA